tara:strand:- start:196 stop:1398 length:1203 start_codon:yes stop_codon:yes gene_type:complete
MTDITDKELLDTLGIEVEKKKSSPLSSIEERIVSGFEEIQNFYKCFKRLPENLEDRDIFERLYAIRLKRIVQQNEYHDLLEEFDSCKLLSGYHFSNSSEKNDEIDDEQLLSELGLTSEDNDLINLRHVRSFEERKLAEEIAKREICKDFEQFKPLFKKVQSELKIGSRKSIPLKERPEIKKDMFFILNGQKTYVADIGTKFMQEYGISDARLYLVFDNGTESRMLMRSLQRALALDESSRIITNTNLGPLFSNIVSSQDKLTGTIYILRSKSKIPYIVENCNLIHKIGFTTQTIEKRISNAITDPTFLLADVEVVDSYKLFNIKSSRFENLIQKIFSKSKLDIEIIDRFGKPFKPNEWFLVPLDVIKDAIQKIIEGTITRYIYDPKLAKMVLINDEKLND